MVLRHLMPAAITPAWLEQYGLLFDEPFTHLYFWAQMGNTASRDELMTVVIPRVLDLRAEFEAQLRAVARLEEQLKKSQAAKNPANADLAAVLKRELAEMFANNTNIRDVLVALAADNDTPVPVVGS